MIRKEYSGAEGITPLTQRETNEASDGTRREVKEGDGPSNRSTILHRGRLVDIRTVPTDQATLHTSLKEAAEQVSSLCNRQCVSTPPRTRSGIDQEKAVSKQCTHCARLEKAAGFPRQASAEIGAAASEGEKKSFSASPWQGGPDPKVFGFIAGS